MIDGAGLGLPLVKCIAQLHGGSIQAESLIDRGAQFIIQLPRFVKPE
jgi:signal transduction histidine kinase